MFWKKARPKSEPVHTKGILDPLDPENQREAFRYVFGKQERITIRFLDRTVTVVDISARGMAFIDQGFSQYDADQIQVDLDIPNYRGSTLFSARLRILYISQDRICHCIFENCTIEQYEMLHKYVLELQKKRLKPRPHDTAY